MPDMQLIILCSSCARHQAIALLFDYGERPAEKTGTGTLLVDGHCGITQPGISRVGYPVVPRTESRSRLSPGRKATQQQHLPQPDESRPPPCQTQLRTPTHH